MVAYRRALAGRPDLSDAHNNLGRLLHERGDLGAAEACYRRALASEPSALHWFNLGVVLEDGCRSEDAMVAYRQALACDEAFVEAHLNLARLLDRRGRVSDAPGDVQEAVRHLVKARQLRRSLG